jgi:hypothetical protein
MVWYWYVCFLKKLRFSILRIWCGKILHSCQVMVNVFQKAILSGQLQSSLIAYYSNQITYIHAHTSELCFRFLCFLELPFKFQNESLLYFSRDCALLIQKKLKFGLLNMMKIKIKFFGTIQKLLAKFLCKYFMKSLTHHRKKTQM